MPSIESHANAKKLQVKTETKEVPKTVTTKKPETKTITTDSTKTYTTTYKEHTSKCWPKEECKTLTKY